MDSAVWFQMENKVRILIKDLVEPTVNRVAEATKIIESQGKAITSAIYKLEDLEVAQSNLMKRLSSIDEFAKKVLEFESLQSIMESRFNRDREELKSRIALFIQRQESFEQNLEVLQNQRELLKTDITELSQAVINQKYELEEKIVQTSDAHKEISSNFRAKFSLLESAISQESKNLERYNKDLIEIDVLAKEAIRISNEHTNHLKKQGKKIEHIKLDYPKEIDKVRNTCIANTNEILNTKNYIKKVEKEMQSDESAIRNEIIITQPLYVIIKDLPTLKALAVFEKERLEKINYKKYSQGIFELWKNLLDKAQDIIDTPLPSSPPPKKIITTGSQKKLKRQRRQNLRKQIAKNISTAVKNLSKVDDTLSDMPPSLTIESYSRGDTNNINITEEKKNLRGDLNMRILKEDLYKTEQVFKSEILSHVSRTESQASRGSRRRRSSNNGLEGEKTLLIVPGTEKKTLNLSVTRFVRKGSNSSNGTKTISRDFENESILLTSSSPIKPPVSLPTVVKDALKKVTESHWVSRGEESIRTTSNDYNFHPRLENYSRPETYSSTSEEDENEEEDSVIDFSPMIEQVKIQLKQEAALMYEDLKTLIESNSKSTNSAIEKSKDELIGIIESIKMSHNNYTSSIKKKIEEVKMQIQQAINECNAASAQRKRDHNDFSLEFKNISETIKSFEKQEACLSNNIESLSRSIDNLIDYCKISIALQNQDEIDRESIFLMGYKQKKQQNAVVSIDKRCLSCTGQSSSIISAFKLACLAYEPSSVMYHDKKFTRNEMLRLQKNILENFSRSPELETSDENREIHNKTMMTNRQWRPLSVPTSRFSTLASPYIKTPDGDNLPLLKKS
ncbi:hypothetical protein SteCoe_33696 [Stentor coeruleus]|uniref:Uncharacterized protein n=1 Tax=Stentor coeruleus TaxID=5963 RepID=A0A1R2AWD7_9CILI|nr:hypothetical protein SteCoe_33696 [Stentor coeruleus]